MFLNITNDAECWYQFLCHRCHAGVEVVDDEANCWVEIAFVCSQFQ